MCIRKESTLNREIMLTLHKNGLHKHLKQVCFSNRSGNMRMRFCTERTAAFKRVSSDISVYFLAWGPECHPQLSEKQPLKQTLLGNPQTELEEHQIHSSAQRKRLISTRFQTRLWESEPGWYQQLLWKHICLFTDNFTQKWNCVIIYEPKTMLFFALRNTQNNNI